MSNSNDNPIASYAGAFLVIMPFLMFAYYLVCCGHELYEDQEISDDTGVKLILTGAWSVLTVGVIWSVAIWWGFTGG